LAHLPIQVFCSANSAGISADLEFLVTTSFLDWQNVLFAMKYWDYFDSNLNFCAPNLSCKYQMEGEGPIKSPLNAYMGELWDILKMM